VKLLNGPPANAMSAGKSAGDSDGGAVKDWPAWFSDLQDTLSASPTWSDVHERGHRLLYRYAMWKVGDQWGIKPVPSNVEFLFRFLGKAEDNEAAISRMNMKISREGGVLMTTTGTFWGTQGASNWCAPASSIPVWKVLERVGMKLQDGGDPQGTWARKAGIQITPSTKTDPKLDAVEIKAGDYVRMVGFHSPLTGHIATAIKADPAGGAPSNLWYVSGNAGRFGGGAVRVDSVQRLAPPEGYSYGRVSEIDKDRDSLKSDMKKEAKAIEAIKAQPYNDSEQQNDVNQAQAQQDQVEAMRQRAIDQAKAQIAKDQQQLAKDDQALRDEAQKTDPEATSPDPEKALRPPREGTVWITLVTRLSQMDLNSLKPGAGADPAMGAYRTKWRISAGAPGGGARY
jgi:hypothetical protein